MTVMLYRPADEPNPEVWDRLVEYRVFDEADATSALTDGWVRHPDELLSEGAGEAAPLKRKGRPPKGA